MIHPIYMECWSSHIFPYLPPKPWDAMAPRYGTQLVTANFDDKEPRLGVPKFLNNKFGSIRQLYIYIIYNIISLVVSEIEWMIGSSLTYPNINRYIYIYWVYGIRVLYGYKPTWSPNSLIPVVPETYRKDILNLSKFDVLSRFWLNC